MMRTIAWDVDDVLNDLMRRWLEDWWLPSHPGCEAGYEQITSNPPHEVLGTTLGEYQSSLDSFRLSGRFARLDPAPEVMSWFGTHGDRFHHVALSAVPLRCAAVSAEWVIRHFGRWVRSFNFVPSPRPDEGLPGSGRGKSEFLRRIGPVDLLVDDHPDPLRGARVAGLRAVVFPRPWNSSGRAVADVLDQLAEVEAGATRVAAGGRPTDGGLTP